MGQRQRRQAAVNIDITEDLKRAGRRLKARREARDWTQTRIGDAIGVSSTTIGRFEEGIPADLGQAGVSVEILLRWARYLDTSLGELFARTQNTHVEWFAVLCPEIQADVHAWCDACQTFGLKMSAPPRSPLS